MAVRGQKLRLDFSSLGTALTKSLVLPKFVKKGNPFDKFFEYDEIGWGAFGSIFQLEYSDGAIKAIKVVNAGLRETQKILKALNEAEIGMQIKHPHLLSIEEVWYDGSRFFFVMDLIEPLVASNLQESVKGKLQLFQQLVSAVAHLYSQGILHRDIKIANTGLKLGEDGKQQLVLLDFGEACKISEHYSECAGTVLNMSPEVVKECQFSDLSEVWALMCYFVELLTGKSMILELFDETHFYISQLHKEMKIDSLTEPPIPEVFKTDKSPSGLLMLQILERGLAIDPKERLTLPGLESLLLELLELL
jgi:serine/threonine protein kinase